MEETNCNMANTRFERLIRYLRIRLAIIVSSTTWESRKVKNDATSHSKIIVNAFQDSLISKMISDVGFDDIVEENYPMNYFKDLLGISGKFGEEFLSILLNPFYIFSPVYITLLVLSAVLLLAIFYIDKPLLYSAVQYAYLCNFSLVTWIAFANLSIFESVSIFPSAKLPKNLEYFIELYPYGWMFCEIFVLLLYCFYIIGYKLHEEEGDQTRRSYIRSKYVRLGVLTSLVVSGMCYFISKIAVTWVGNLLLGFYVVNVVILVIIFIPLGCRIMFVLNDDPLN
ncbi:uncharacterized protein VICG_01685 [Vittaforma corneae ATCC 50505]|uniref:Uncharacterized protein n=1 Tax=Vittaforma corneae (strain ATCC 50505) TaxID=993615 RepID=L2GLY9_VITCO|nr:uncharacterized protein VICG_01685 [Vittaforma corneae ATCC 50505]ELA41312.1 hypothetical protein VICG_01685 [Vittaforma corneae ATCC 50505]